MSLMAGCLFGFPDSQGHFAKLPCNKCSAWVAFAPRSLAGYSWPACSGSCGCAEAGGSATLMTGLDINARSPSSALLSPFFWGMMVPLLK